MKTISDIRRMALAALVAAAFSCFFTSCESVEEEPPMNEYTSGRAYRIPDPTPMTAAERSDYDAIRSEYQNAIQ